MNVFAIGDLHLGFSLDKPMNIFGEHWNEHYQKIKREWYRLVRREDLVIVAGDSSWAMRMEEASIDLEWIDALPGHKVFIKGNHDYWWQSLTRMDGMYQRISFLLNNSYTQGGVRIAGTRGWLLPGTEAFQAEDEKIYLRETARLQRSLEMASREGGGPLIAAFHYPPLNRDAMDNEFLYLLKQYGVSHVLYGHLHDKESWESAPKGLIEGMEFHLVSCDYLGFSLKKILGQPHD